MSNHFRIPNRFFSDVYDEHAQKSEAALDDQQGMRDYLARLRLDTFIYPKIVLKDSTIFDGSFFLNLSISGLMNELPIEKMEIRSRSPDLENALIGMFRRAAHDKLFPVLLTALPSPEAAEIRERLPEFKNSEIESARDLIRILNDIGVDKEIVRKLKEGWEDILSTLTRRRASVSVWTPFEFPAQLAEILSSEREAVKSLLNTGLGREMEEEIWGARDERNDVAAHVSWYKTQAKTLPERVDALTIESWFLSGYNRTVAASHNCSDPEVSYAWHSRPYTDDINMLDSISNNIDIVELDNTPDILLETNGNFCSVLGSIRKDLFDQAVNEVEVSGIMTHWRRSGDFRSLQDGAAMLAEKVDAVHSFSDDKRLPSAALFGLRVVAGFAAEEVARHFAAPVGIAAPIGIIAGYAIPELSRLAAEEELLQFGVRENLGKKYRRIGRSIARIVAQRQES